MELDERYREQLRKLLPRGRAWAVRADATLFKLLHAEADELARVELLAKTLIEESDPRRTELLLPEWESMAGLPDDCEGPGETLQARRDLLLRLLTGAGGSHLQDFLDAASAVGFSITLTEFTPAQIGDDVGIPMQGVEWWYALQVDAPLDTVTLSVVGGARIGEPLAFWGNNLLECVLARVRQAQTALIFVYT